MANVNKFQLKKAEAEILESLSNALDERMKEAGQEYRRTDEQVQKKNWKTDELVWEDEEKTIPVMEDVWAWVNIPENEMTDDRVAIVMACTSIKKELEKLL